MKVMKARSYQIWKVKQCLESYRYFTKLCFKALLLKVFCFQVVKARNGELSSWEELGCLKSNVAFIILIDQFCRNIYRVKSLTIHLLSLYMWKRGVQTFFGCTSWILVYLYCGCGCFPFMQAVVLFLSETCYWLVSKTFGWLCENVFFIPRGQQTPSVTTLKLWLLRLR